MANRRAMLVCGDSSILWSQFRRCIVALIGRKGLDLSQHNSLVKLQGLCIGSTNLTISGVIEEHFNRCCADPRGQDLRHAWHTSARLPHDKWCRNTRCRRHRCSGMCSSLTSITLTVSNSFGFVGCVRSAPH